MAVQFEISKLFNIKVAPKRSFDVLLVAGGAALDVLVTLIGVVRGPPKVMPEPVVPLFEDSV